MADLKRKPIRYARPLRPPEGWTLAELEAYAHRFTDQGVRVEASNGSGPQFQVSRTVARIQQLIIEQQGWPS